MHRRTCLPLPTDHASLAVQERPCTRCIKRNIGHLCHDEPRESVKKSKTDPDGANGDNDSQKHEAPPSDSARNSIDQRTNAPDAGLNLAPPPVPVNRDANTPAIAQPTPVSAPQLPALASDSPSRKLHTGPALNEEHTELY